MERICVLLMSSKKFIFRFFLTYFCVLIPLIGVSIIALHTSIETTKKQELQMIDNHLFQVMLSLNEYQNKCENMSYQLSLHDLLQENRLNNGINAYYACNYLKNASVFDPLLENVFIYYGGSTVYCSSGTSSVAYYFPGVLN